MTHLLGVLFRSPHPGFIGGVRGYQALSPHGVLLGPNGAGKTTLLRAIDAAYRAARSPGRPSPEREPPECAFVIELTAPELVQLIESQLRSYRASFEDPNLDDDEQEELPVWLEWPPIQAIAELCASDLASASAELRAALVTSGWLWTGNVLKWCLPPFDDLTDSLRDEVVNDYIDDLSTFGLSLDEGRQQRIPVPIVQFDRSLWPTVMRVPIGKSKLTTVMLDEFDYWIRATSRRFSIPRQPIDWSVSEDDGATLGPRRELETLCELVSQLSTDMLPSFLKDSSVCVTAKRFSAWGRSGRPELDVQLEGPSGNLVAYDEGPGGFVMWVELAILEAVDTLRGLTTHVREWSVNENADIAIRDVLDTGKWEQESILEALDGSPDVPRHRLYLLDEPEQSLHPRLQRSAVGVLEALAARRGSALITTHSPHFLNLDAAAYTYVVSERTANGRAHRWSATPLDPYSRDPLSIAASEMGFDRGELLAGVQTICFVEGETDAVFLTAAALPDLHRAGVLIVAFGGVVSASFKSVIDSQLAAIGAWNLAIVFDKLGADPIRKLREDSEHRVEVAARSKSTELREMARFMQRHVETERRIHYIGIEVPDIFDLVDETVVREVSQRESPAEVFPGHEEARRAVGAGKWKNEYLERYGLNILDPGLFRELGRLTAERGVRTHGLVTLIDRLGALSDDGHAPRL